MLVQDSRGIGVELEQQINQGGEARILEVKGKPDLVAKVYHANKVTAEHEAKLNAMLGKPPTQPATHTAIAWPIELLYQQGQLVGFLMPKIKGYDPIVKFYNPARRKTQYPGFNREYLHRTAYNLAVAVEAVHHAGHLIGDVNESNILANDQALVTLVDADSFQIRDKQGQIYRCAVGKAEYTPHELQGVSFQLVNRRPEHDDFGLAVLIFQLLMEGYHPFSGVLPANLSVTRVDLYGIKQGLFPYAKQSTMTPPKNAPSFDILHPDIQAAFIRCFVDGHHDPTQRPTAKEWQSLLDKAEHALIACSRNPNHFYSNHLTACPFCPSQPASQKPLPPARRTTHQKALSPARRTTPQASTGSSAHQSPAQSISGRLLPSFLPPWPSVAGLLLILLLIGSLAIASLGGFGETGSNTPLEATVAATESIAVAPKATNTPAATRAASKTATRAASKTAIRAASKIATQAPVATQVAANTEATADAQATVDAQANTQATADAQATAVAQATANAQANAQATFDAQAQAQANTQATADAQANVQATVDAQVAAQAAAAQATADAQANAQAQANTQATADAQANAQATFDAQAQANTQATADAQAAAAQATADAQAAAAQATADAQANAQATFDAQATAVQATADAQANAQATFDAQATAVQATADAQANAQATFDAQATAVQATADAQADAQATADAQAFANAQATANAQAAAQAAAQATADAQAAANAQATADAQAAANAQATADAQAAAQATADAQAAAVVQRHNMVQIYVPAGEFEMGSADDDRDGRDDEKPRHTVYLDDFWIDQTEVTNAMFANFLNEMGNQVEGDVTWLHEEDDDVLIERVNGTFQPKNGFANHPVVEVSWYGANTYCQWAGHRLPTEAEWEKAAGGTDGRKYPWGNDAPTGELLNFCDQNCTNDWKDSSTNDGYQRTSPVGNYPAGASPYGALDMASNVWEWVSDFYNSNYYASSPRENPTGPSSSGGKAHRGGSWYDSGPDARVRNRNEVGPDFRDEVAGFRCARSP